MRSCMCWKPYHGSLHVHAQLTLVGMCVEGGGRWCACMCVCACSHVHVCVHKRVSACGYIHRAKPARTSKLRLTVTEKYDWLLYKNLYAVYTLHIVAGSRSTIAFRFFLCLFVCSVHWLINIRLREREKRNVLEGG